MTNQQHPIIPPPELVQQWIDANKTWLRGIALEAAQWGADQELEACCHYFAHDFRESLALELRATRRSKPPSLKELALETLQRISKDKYPCNYQEDSDWDTIRRALEALPDG
jgi:hypothetical protein